MRRKKPRDRGGRPLRFTTPAALAIVTAVANGESLDEAARSAGVGPSTLYRWMALGKAGDSRFAPLVDALSNARTAEFHRRMFAQFGLILLKRGF